MTAIGAALSGFVKLQNLGDNFPDGKVAEVQWCWGATTGDKTIVDSWHTSNLSQEPREYPCKFFWPV